MSTICGGVLLKGGLDCGKGMENGMEKGDENTNSFLGSTLTSFLEKN